MAQGSNRQHGRQGRGGGAGSGRRDGRAKAAEAHTEEMARRFAGEIEQSVRQTLAFDGVPKKAAAPAEPAGAKAEPAESSEPAEVSEPAEAPASAVESVSDSTGEQGSAVPSVSVVDQDAVAAIIERGRGRAQFCDLAVLDFASFTSPGGGYIRGAMAQEEALCSESFLYNVLKEQKAWYAENRRRNLNCNLYRDRALVAPKIRFTRDRTHAYADVIVTAAPNATYARKEYNVADDVLERAMRARIRLVMAIADELGHEKLILGAYGCGVFGWDADVVARMFVEELGTGAHAAKEVVFAIPKVSYNENYARFEHAFATFPAQNEESFAEASARAAAERTAQAAADDEDEDDWRKYL